MCIFYMQSIVLLFTFFPALNVAFWLCCRKINSIFCMMTFSLIWSTSPICSCMGTVSVPSLKMCSGVWSTWTVSFCMTIASGRSTARPFVTLAVLPSSTCSTTPWLSYQDRPWKMSKTSSSSASMVTPGPVAVRHVPFGSGSARPASPHLTLCALPHLHVVVRTSDSSEKWISLSALFLTPALWLDPPQPPSVPRPAGGSPRTNLNPNQSPCTRRAQKQWSHSLSLRSSLSSPPSMNCQLMRQPSPNSTKKNTGPTMAMKIPLSAVLSWTVLQAMTTKPSPHSPP